MLLAKISITRRIIYTLMTMAFIASAAIILLFTFGYRFNFQNKVFIHSGTITLKTTPRRVVILLNGKEIDSNAYDLINNSYNINGLKPGAYDLEVKSDGYAPWKKRIDVHSGIATEFWNVFLTKTVPDGERLDIVSPALYKVATSGEKILYSTRANGPLQIFMYSTKKGTLAKVFEEPSNRKDACSLEFIEFSPREDRAILGIREGDRNSYFIAYLDKIESQGANTENLIRLDANLAVLSDSKVVFTGSKNVSGTPTPSPNPERSPLKIKLNSSSLGISLEEYLQISQSSLPIKQFYNFKWLDNDNFCFVYESGLYGLSINKEEIVPILKDIRGYEISQERIFFMRPPSNLIFECDRNGEGITQITENMIDQDLAQEAQKYKLVVYDENRIAIINGNKELYLFNNNSDEYQTFKKLSDNTDGVQFSDDGKKMLYFNENAIKVYYLREWEVQPKKSVGSNIELYRNESDKIRDAMWSKDYQHIIFALAGKIKIIELDTRDGANISDVVDSSLPNSQFTFNTSNETLYYLQPSDRFIQLFQIKLSPADGIF